MKEPQLNKIIRAAITQYAIRSETKQTINQIVEEAASKISNLTPRGNSMLLPQYKKYVGQYAKRFYSPFTKKNIFKIIGYREVVNYDKETPMPPLSEFCYQQLEGTMEFWWTDVDDSVVITNEPNIIEDNRIANVNHPKYKGYNPFEK